MNIEKKYHFVYIVTNLITTKQYIGDHSTNKLEDGYLGSGVYLQHAIKEYGKENFKREILESFTTKEEAFNAQEKYIEQYNTLSPNGYNISPKGGHRVIGCFSEETKQKLGKIWKNRKHKQESKLKMGRKGRRFSVESISKMKESAKNRKPQSEETRKKRSNSMKGKNTGKKQSQETIKKRLLSRYGHI